MKQTQGISNKNKREKKNSRSSSGYRARGSEQHSAAS